MHAAAIGRIDAGNAYEVAGAEATAVITAAFGDAGGIGRAEAMQVERNARRVVEAFRGGVAGGDGRADRVIRAFPDCVGRDEAGVKTRGCNASAALRRGAIASGK